MSAHEITVGNVVDVGTPAAVGGLTLFGVGLPDVVLILTALYTILRIGGWVYDRIIKPRRDDDGSK